MNTSHRPIGYQATTTRNVSVAVLTFDGLEAEGDAKRNNGERFDPEVGLDLAMGRAFLDLGHQLVDRGLERLETA